MQRLAYLRSLHSVFSALDTSFVDCGLIINHDNNGCVLSNYSAIIAWLDSCVYAIMCKNVK